MVMLGVAIVGGVAYFNGVSRNNYEAETAKPTQIYTYPGTPPVYTPPSPYKTNGKYAPPIGPYRVTPTIPIPPRPDYPNRPTVIYPDVERSDNPNGR